MPAEHVKGQPSHIEHEGGHQDMIGHGQDLTCDGHVGRLSKVKAICGLVCRNKKCSSE